MNLNFNTLKSFGLQKIVVIIFVFFSNFSNASDMQYLDDVLRQAGIKRTDLHLFDNIETFRSRPTTNGFLKNNSNNIVSLRIIGGSIDSLTYISRLIHLKSLIIFDNKLTNLDGIEKLQQLQFLDAAENKIVDISSLNKIKSLKVVNLEMNVFKGLMPFRYYWGNRTAKIITSDGYVTSRFEVENLRSDFPENTLLKTNNGSRRIISSANKGKVILKLSINIPAGKYFFNVKSEMLTKIDTKTIFKLTVNDNFIRKGSKNIQHSFDITENKQNGLYSYKAEVSNDLIDSTLMLVTDFNIGEVAIDYLDISPVNPSKNMINFYKNLNLLLSKNIKLHL